MALPLPNLPAGCVRITFQANIDGFPPRLLILTPRVVAKLQRLATETMDYSMTPPARKWAGMTEMFQQILDKYVLSVAEDAYPDAPDPTVAQLEAELAAAKIAAQPKFL